MPTRVAIAIIVVAELFGTALSFSAHAVADALQRLRGVSTMRSPSLSISTVAPGVRPHSSAIGAGIRTARLLPHF